VRTADEHVVVVGASAAGLSVVEGLRREGFAGRVSLIGDEPHLPYDRPPLSKQFLSGNWERARLTLRDQDGLDALGVELMLGAPAVSLDLAAAAVELADGWMMSYDHLVIATGVRPLMPAAWAGMPGVLALRSIEDAESVRDALRSGARALIIGAGFIGAEAASSWAQAGVGATMVDPLAHPMVRVLGPKLGEMLAEVHRDHGVDVRCGVSVVELKAGLNAGVCARLSDGSTVDADVALVGIGSTPNVDWLGGSGLMIDNGLECDGCCRAAPNVYAAGDVASWIDGDRRRRVEHRMHAAEQGDYVARAIMAGKDLEPFATVPFFWSDQQGLKIQSHGIVSGDYRTAVIEGSVADRRLLVTYEQDGVVEGVVGINMPRETRLARDLVGRPAALVSAT
jgi:NADPH-dependent 2,4-dienoyl-CoA reductase/sulfur reductase-like enzyme